MLLILNVSLWIECRIPVSCDNMGSRNAINVLVVYFSELSETTVLMNLKKRYDQELIYVCMPNVKYANEITQIIKSCGNCLLKLLIHSVFSPLSFSSKQTYIGSILVSVNPYKLLNIYGTDMVLQYAGRGLSDNPP